MEFLNKRIFAKKSFFLFTGIFSLIGLFSCQNKDQEKLNYLLEGNEFLEAGDYQKAIRRYDQVISIDPEFADAYNNRGVAYFESRRFGEALDNYNRAVQLKPEYYSAILNRSHVYSELGRTNSALRDLETIRRAFPDTSLVYFSSGLVKTRSRDYGGALKDFGQAWRLDSANIEIPLNIGTVYYYQQSFDSAEYFMRLALEMDPEEGNAYNALALISIDRGDKQEAFTMVERALDLAPNEPFYLNNRGYIYLQMDSLDRAIADINESIRIDPYNGWAYRNKGLCMLRGGDHKRAVKLLRQAADLDTSIDKVFFYLGEAYLLNGEQTETCQAWKEGEKVSDEMSKMKLQETCNPLQ